MNPGFGWDFDRRCFAQSYRRSPELPACQCGIRHDASDPGEVAAQRVDQHGPLPNQQVAPAVVALPRF
jgi:hypothetical protein